jgi:hypothetical protein
MANYNLTSQEIRNTFEQLAQVSGSIEGGITGAAVVDGTGSRITTLQVTASNANNAVSASFATTALSASYAPGTGVTSIIAGTGISVDQATGNVTVTNTQGAAATGSLLVTSSVVNDTITFTKGDGSTYTNVINNVSQSIEAEDLVITVKNTSGGTLAKGTAVHAVSVTGENVDVIAASNDSAATMPAIGLLGVELTNNSAGNCIIAGRDTGLNTTGLVAGDSVYVHTGGALTSTKPTGSALIQNIGTAAKIDASNGEIIVQGSGRVNDLPNLTNNYVWKGDSNGVPQAVDQSTLSVASASYAVTSSHVTDPNIAYINKNNTFTGTQSFNNISVAGTGSFGYIQSVTGSAKIIGDAFIILNNDTPAQQYAGVIVQDSGSVLTTSSFQWDGANNEWFLEYSDDGGATAEHGIALFGPEYATKGSPTYLTNNKIPKSDGGHHLNDSNITDDGSRVTIASQTDITGSLRIQGSGTSFPLQVFPQSTTAFISLGSSDNTARLGGYRVYRDSGINGTGYGIMEFRNANSGGNAQNATIGNSEFTGLDGSNTVFYANNNVGGNNYLWWTSENFPYLNVPAQASFTAPVSASAVISASGGIIGDLTGAATSAATASYVNPLVQDVQITGATSITGSLVSSGSSVNLFQESPTSNGQLAKSLEFSENTSIRGNTYDSNYIGAMNYTAFTDKTDKALTMWKGKANLSEYGFIYNSGNTMGMYMRNVSSSTGDVSLFTDHGGSGDANFKIVCDNVEIDPRSSFKMDGTSAFTSIEIGRSSITSFKLVTDEVNAIQITGSLDLTQDINTRGLLNTGSFINSGSFVNDGSLIYTGSSVGNLTALAIASNTASIDFRDGDYFTLNLVSGSNTHLEINPSGTKVKQPDPGSGTLSYGSNFKFPGGTIPTVTDGTLTEDIFTFVNFGFNETYVTALNNMS